MTTAALTLVASYVALALLLLIMILYSRVHWGLKAGVIVLVSAFYPVSYLALMALLGWPTGQLPPDRFRLVAAQVYEPNKQQSTPGAIYLWATDISEKAGRVTPRSYEVPYSATLHTKVVEATKGLQKGVPQIGEIEEEKTPGIKALDVTDTSQTESISSRISFYALSDIPLLPGK